MNGEKKGRKLKDKEWEWEDYGSEVREIEGLAIICTSSNKTQQPHITVKTDTVVTE